MTTPRDISDLGILGSKFRRRFLKGPCRDPGTDGRLRKTSTRALPGLEVLEDRMLLTTYTVNSNADTNTGTATTGTLRYVLTQLDSSGGFSWPFTGVAMA